MKKILLLPGDGVGPECIVQAKKIIAAVENKFDCKFSVEEAPIAGVAYDACGDALPESTVQKALESDAVLVGSWGGSKWNGIAGMKPSRLLELRQRMEVYLNIRAISIYPQLAAFCPIKNLRLDHDIVVLRELLGGAYFGEKKHETVDGVEEAVDAWCYTNREVERVGRIAYEYAQKRRKKLVSADKAGPLICMDLWRKVMTDLNKNYPEVELENIFVDNCAMQLVTMPEKFDVIVAENCFGDILSDVLSALTGLPSIATSVCVGDGPGLYEVSHGTWEEYVGKDNFNPISVITLVAMMLRYNLGEEAAAEAVEKAIEKVLTGGYRTEDMQENGCTQVGMSKFTDLVVESLLNP